MEAEGRVGGSQALASGATAPISLGQYGQALTGNVSASFQEAVRKGNCYIAVDTTVRLLDAPDTVPVGMTVANPAGSGKRLVLWYAAAAHNGTALTTGGVVELTANVNTVAAAVAAGTAVTIRNCLLGGAASSVASASVAATLPAAGTGILSLGLLSTGAATVELAPAALAVWINGALILGPNTAVSFNSTVALVGAGGGAINCTLVWEEIDN